MKAQPHSDHSAGVRLSGVSKSFEEVEAVRGISLEIPAGTFFSLLGPSGCGKSTTLRMIAGFETPESGSIYIGGEDMTGRSPQSRPTAMVFQNYALFPHMNVAENVAYGLRVRRVEKSERERRVRSALVRVEMGAYLETPVTELSGGQQQRIALARAIATEPDVLLFDEPLSNLDAALREQTRSELKQIQASLGTTSLYVTHDQEEALALSDQIAIMRNGEIVQTGTPKSLYEHPRTAFVASFLGRSNILDGELAARLAGEDLRNGSVLSVRAECIKVGKGGMHKGRITSVQYLGRISTLWIEWEGTEVRAVVASGADLAESVEFNVSSFSWVKDDR